MKSRSNFRLFAFVALIVIIGLACGGLTQPTPVPSVPTPFVPPPTPVPQEPTPTDAPVIVQPQSQQFFTEEFEGGLDDWSLLTVSDSSDTNPDALSIETDGGYAVFDIPTKYLYAYLFYEPYEYEDVSLEVRVDNRGTNNNNISLICRYSDEGWYEFNIANNGLYDILLGKETPDGRISYAPIADGGSNKIRAGKEVNEYKIVCKGRQLSMYINGFETRVLDDNKYALRDGKIGISASSFNDPTVRVEYDWVKISEP